MGKNRKNKKKNILVFTPNNSPLVKSNNQNGLSNQNNNSNALTSSQQPCQQNQNHDMTSLEWFQQRQKISYWQQRPCVILLEFCQFHKLPSPKYVLRSSRSANKKSYWFDCIIGERVFNPNRSCKDCWYQDDAIDYISTQVFNRLFNEYKQKTSGQHDQRTIKVHYDEEHNKDVYICTECCSKSNLELFHKELEEYQKKEEEEADRNKDSFLDIGNLQASNAQQPNFNFITNSSVNLFQTTINNQSKFVFDFGETSTFVQQQRMRPVSRQVSVPSTLTAPDQSQSFFDQSNDQTAQTTQDLVQHYLPESFIPYLKNVQESQNSYMQSSVLPSANIKEAYEASFISQASENSMISPAITDAQLQKEAQHLVYQPSNSISKLSSTTDDSVGQ